MQQQDPHQKHQQQQHQQQQHQQQQHQQQHQQQQQQQHQTQTTTIQTTNVRPQNSRHFLVEKRKRTLKYLGISETVISTSCVILGGLAFSVIKNYFVNSIRSDYKYGVHYNYGVLDINWSITIGEGIWASILPFIAGIFGILAGGKQSNKCKLQAHMGLAIVSACLSAVLFITSLIFNLISFRSMDGYKAILGMITVLAFINFILFIVSAAYTCALLPNYGCCNDGTTQEMVTATTTSQQPPVMYLVPTSGEQINHPQQFTNVHNGTVYQNQMTSSNSGTPMTSYCVSAPPMMSTSLPVGGQQNMMTSYAVTGHNQQVMTKQQPPAYAPTQ